MLEKEQFSHIDTLSSVDVLSATPARRWQTAERNGRPRFTASRIAQQAKIVIDVSLAFIGIIIVAPVFIIMAAVVMLDGGPILFGHPRVGQGGRVFRCLKMRTMVVDSEAVLQRLLDSDPAAAEEWARTRKLRRDPRITRFGRVLRRTSLDELPQLLNVVRLEMSLVGPRPIVTAEIPRYGDAIAEYFKVRPGLTGLWQVGGRSDTSYALRVELDRRYVQTWTLWLDFLILLRTLPAVLRRDGAC